MRLASGSANSGGGGNTRSVNCSTSMLILEMGSALEARLPDEGILGREAGFGGRLGFAVGAVVIVGRVDMEDVLAATPVVGDTEDVEGEVTADAAEKE